jgi:hypothetical protein
VAQVAVVTVPPRPDQRGALMGRTHMRTHHVRTLAAAAGAVVAAGVMLAVNPASAAPPAAVSYGTFECSDGTTIEPFGQNKPHFPVRTGFLDGKGVVAQWLTERVSGHLELTDPAENVPVDAFFEGPTNASHRTAAPPNLSGLTDCTMSFPIQGEPVTLDADAVAFLGLDESYIGRSGVAFLTDERTVWLNPNQVKTRGR